MINKREAFLEKQINLYNKLIDELENSRLNREQKQDLQNLKVLHEQYIQEQKVLLDSQITV